MLQGLRFLEEMLLKCTLVSARVLACPDLSGKEPNRQVGMGKVVTSGSLDDQMLSTLAPNARGEGSNPSLGEIFHIFITTMMPVSVTWTTLKLRTVWLLNLLCACICVSVLVVCM